MGTSSVSEEPDPRDDFEDRCQVLGLGILGSTTIVLSLPRRGQSRAREGYYALPPPVVSLTPHLILGK